MHKKAGVGKADRVGEASERQRQSLWTLELVPSLAGYLPTPDEGALCAYTSTGTGGDCTEEEQQQLSPSTLSSGASVLHPCLSYLGGAIRWAA